MPQRDFEAFHILAGHRTVCTQITPEKSPKLRIVQKKREVFVIFHDFSHNSIA